MKKILSEKDIRKKSWTIEVKPRDVGKAKKLIDQVSTSLSSGGSAGNMFMFYDSADAKQVRMVLRHNNVGILSADFA